MDFKISFHLYSRRISSVLENLEITIMRFIDVPSFKLISSHLIEKLHSYHGVVGYDFDRHLGILICSS